MSLAAVLQQIQSSAKLATQEYLAALIAAVEGGSEIDYTQLEQLASRAGFGLPALLGHLNVLSERKRVSEDFARADELDRERERAQAEFEATGRKILDLSPLALHEKPEVRKQRDKWATEQNGRLALIKNNMRRAVDLRENAKFVLERSAPKAEQGGPLQFGQDQGFIGDPHDWRNIDLSKIEPVDGLCGPQSAVVPVREYGAEKQPHLRAFSVDFYGRGDTKYIRPVLVPVALDGSDAWSQVVAHYGLDNPTNFRPIIRQA